MHCGSRQFVSDTASSESVQGLGSKVATHKCGAPAREYPTRLKQQSTRVSARYRLLDTRVDVREIRK